MSKQTRTELHENNPGRTHKRKKKKNKRKWMNDDRADRSDMYVLIPRDQPRLRRDEFRDLGE